jgi:hypothetical protein
MAKTRRNVPKGHRDQKKSNRLPLYFILGGIAVLIIAAFFAFPKKSSSFTPEVTGKPNLVADKEAVDLGDVKLGQTVNVSFELKNTGDRAVEFSKAPYIELKEGC